MRGRQGTSNNHKQQNQHRPREGASVRGGASARHPPGWRGQADRSPGPSPPGSRGPGRGRSTGQGTGPGIRRIGREIRDTDKNCIFINVICKNSGSIVQM